MSKYLVACLALALSACGGGGSNVKSDPPPAGGGKPVELPYIATETLIVDSGESVTKPVVLVNTLHGARVDNAGSIGGAVDVAISTHPADDGATIWNYGGGTIDGRQYALKVGQVMLTNEGAGSAIRSAGTAVSVETEYAYITNRSGASIIGGNIGLSLEHGGSVLNEVGSTIAATGEVQGDCGAGGSCAIYASDRIRLVNEGTIIGNVQLAPDVSNSLLLRAGGVIDGDLDMGHIGVSDLTVDIGAGVTQASSQTVTGQTTFSGTVDKTGEGTWIIDSDMTAGASSIALKTGSIIVTDPDAVAGVNLHSWGDRFVFDLGRAAVVESVFHGVHDSTASQGKFVKLGSDELAVFQRNLESWPTFIVEEGTLRIIGNGTQQSAFVENNGALILDGNMIIYSGSFFSVSGTGSLLRTGGGNAVLGLSTYTGGTTIENGGLYAQSVIPGDVVIHPAGTLGFIAMNPHGVGGVSGNVVNDGTVIAADVATAIGGNYYQTSTGTLAVELGGKIEVAGAATLEGGTLEVNGVDLTFIANARTEVLRAAGGLTGTFDQFIETSADLVLASSTIYYDDNSVWLDTTGLDVTWALTSGDVGYTAASANSAKRVQGAFDQLNQRITTDTLAGVSGDFLRSAGRFQRAPTIAAAQASLRSLSGELHAIATTMSFRAIDAGNQALSDRLDGLRGDRSTFGMWTKQLGSGGAMSRSGFDGVGFQLGGWLVGNDYRIGSAGVLGFAFGQGVGTQQVQHVIDRNESRYTEGTLYAATAGERWYTRGRIGFGQFQQDINRGLLLGRAFEGVRTRYQSRYRMAHAEVGMQFSAGGLRLTPFAGMDYARVDRDAFEEEGAGGFGLRSDAHALVRWQANMGVRATRQWNFGGGKRLDVGLHAQQRRVLDTNGESMQASFAGIEQWSPLLGIGLSRRSTLVGFGVNASLSSRSSFRFAYDYERGEYDSAGGVSAGVSVAF